MQSRRWTWTLNNYTLEEECSIRALVERQAPVGPVVTFLIFGREQGQQGTYHLQGYLEVARKARLGGIKALPGMSRAHLERSEGSQEENIRYCEKDGVHFRFGSPMREEGGRKDLDDRLLNLITDNRRVFVIAKEDPSMFIRFHRGIERYLQVIGFEDEADVPRSFKTEVIVYEGETGTGKSRRAHEVDQVGWTHNGDRWFDGYCGQESVLFDDFEGVKSGVPYRKLLQLLDRYPLSVPIKGSFANWRPRKVVFTTNVPPSMWYPDDAYAPLERRIDKHAVFRVADGEVDIHWVKE